MTTSQSPMLDTLRDGFARVVYTHKTHEKQIEALGREVTAYKWCQLIAMALTSGGALWVIIGQQRICEVVTAVLAVISLGITIYGWSLDPKSRIALHRLCAKELWHIREGYLNLISDLMLGRIGDDQAAVTRDALVEQLATLYRFAPDTTPKAYRRACEALQVSRELSFTDEEIDTFLPLGLRKKQ